MDSFEAKKTKSKISCLGTFKHTYFTLLLGVSVTIDIPTVHCEVYVFL
jgi:hypothetical protein